MCSSTFKLSTISNSTSSQLSGEDYLSFNALTLVYTTATCSVAAVCVSSSSSFALAIICLFETVKNIAESLDCLPVQGISKLVSHLVEISVKYASFENFIEGFKINLKMRIHKPCIPPHRDIYIYAHVHWCTLKCIPGKCLHLMKPNPNHQSKDHLNCLDVEVCKLRPKSIVGVSLSLMLNLELWFTNKQAFQYPCYSKISKRLPK